MRKKEYHQECNTSYYNEQLSNHMEFATIITLILMMIVAFKRTIRKSPDTVEHFAITGWMPQSGKDAVFGFVSTAASTLGLTDWYAERKEAYEKDVLEPAAGMSCCCCCCLLLLSSCCPMMFMV